MNASAFCITFSSLFSTDDFKSIFIELGNIDEVKVQEITRGRITGYKYIIHMKSWTKQGEYFRNELLETWTVRYCYGDDGRRPLYFICEPVN